ncbi:MAG: site-specific DNA-methyltransferase [Nitrospirae bacterium]|nr:site-specific DNA-methyltransferase [Nitrospirota bacterium]
MSRKKDFEKIRSVIPSGIRVSTPHAILIEGDSLEVLKNFPAHSVSLVLTDPPYHATQKRNIYGDTMFKEDNHYLEWMSHYAVEWRRILKPNGSLFCFCDSSMVARLENMFSGNFNILAQIVWTKPNDPGFDGWKQKMKKESLRQWYAHSERIIFAEPAFNGNLYRSYFGKIILEARKKADMSAKDLTEMIGAYGKINHGGAVCNWEAGRNVPSVEQYEKLRKALIDTGKVESMPDYKDLIRPFMVDASKEFTDVWTFPSVRPFKGKHPAEKPIEMLMHAIESTTYPGDIVLDCFSGSGNTAISALKLGRLSISIELDPAWVASASSKLEYVGEKVGGKVTIQKINLFGKKKENHLSLFQDIL